MCLRDPGVAQKSVQCEDNQLRVSPHPVCVCTWLWLNEEKLSPPSCANTHSLSPNEYSWPANICSTRSMRAYTCVTDRVARKVGHSTSAAPRPPRPRGRWSWTPSSWARPRPLSTQLQGGCIHTLRLWTSDQCVISNKCGEDAKLVGHKSNTVAAAYASTKTP